MKNSAKFNTVLGLKTTFYSNTSNENKVNELFEWDARQSEHLYVESIPIANETCEFRKLSAVHSPISSSAINRLIETCSYNPRAKSNNMVNRTNRCICETELSISFTVVVT